MILRVKKKKKAQHNNKRTASKKQMANTYKLPFTKITSCFNTFSRFPPPQIFYV